jgi:GH25 family lysozyme M1 (1,4-beta-N-acetylmuramidase)
MDHGRRAAFIAAARHIAGRATVPVVLALACLTVFPLGPDVADAAGTRMTADCAVHARLRPSSSSSLRVTLPSATVVTISGTFSGGHYVAHCQGTIRSHYWYAITIVGTRSVRSLYGVNTLYVPAGLLRPSSAGYTAGLDVSQWNGWIDWRDVRATGRRFVYIRATAGRLTTDSAYAKNLARAKAAGLFVGAYHFAHPDISSGDATREADHFLAVADLEHGMLRPALDLETGSRLGTARLQRWVKTWLERVNARTGAKAVIYTTQSFWQSYMGNSTWFAANGYRVLWVAHWGATTPRVPASSWDGRGWTMWQYSSCGHVSGISSDCTDLDRFRGSDLWSLTF